MSVIRWLPLESNPEVMNRYIRGLGAPTEFDFHDVIGLDPDLLLMIPRPVLAVLLLFPLSSKSESEPIGKEIESPNVYFMKQTIGNACGTVGIIHALCNNVGDITLDGEKHLTTFYAETKDLSPAERGKKLETDHAFGEAHEESAQEGQTQAPSREDNVDLHFVAFVHKDGGLYELDGRKDAPVLHGSTSASTLLEDTAAVIRKFMERDPENLNFTVVALAKAE